MMRQKINENDIHYSINSTHKGGILIDSEAGACNGFCMGISQYFSEEFGEEGIHEDQEGFYVLEGKGTALIGGEEFDIIMGDSFLVPAGVKHTLKKNKTSEVLKVLWSHGAI